MLDTLVPELDISGKGQLELEFQSLSIEFIISVSSVQGSPLQPIFNEYVAGFRTQLSNINK